jgi:hypothetical protein
VKKTERHASRRLSDHLTFEGQKQKVHSLVNQVGGMRENCSFRGGRRRALQWAPPPTRHAAPSGLDASQTAVEITKNTAAVSLGNFTPMFPRINFDTQGREKMRVTRMKRAHPFGQKNLALPS